MAVLLAGIWFASRSAKAPQSPPGPEIPNRPVPATITLAPVKPQFTNTLGMPFVRLPGSKTFLCVWATRRQDYETFTKETHRAWIKPSFQQGPDHPAVNVSWDDAKAFCEWLSRKEKRDYRLPTDAEWSLAAGLPPEPGSTPMEKDGQIKDVYPWGQLWPPPANSGNYATSLHVDDYEKTSPVGVFGANRNGYYDMGGNVWQWCEDWYDTRGKNRVLRGGAWNSCVPEITRSSFRYYANPAAGYDYVGFRCVLEMRTNAVP
jgi:formylglycine-generating enzyme required for sulfatase activity